MVLNLVMFALETPREKELPTPFANHTHTHINHCLPSLVLPTVDLVLVALETP